jgi:Rps23 Pro-64 3,4-dihydroxylase Tpa1-like proline 4-hydroxylase|tara:strand:+ start:45 stop:281 length:237 start_codon:yes stop_codon:yes gene_type:complete
MTTIKYVILASFDQSDIEKILIKRKIEKKRTPEILFKKHRTKAKPKAYDKSENKLSFLHLNITEQEKYTRNNVNVEAV